MNKLIAPSLIRRNLFKSRDSSRSGYFNFIFPHSFTGTNNAYNNVPSKRPDGQKTEFHEGDVAPLAHTQVRVFPDWYKPYLLNYTSDGYMLLFFGVFAIFGYSYMNDIKE